MTSLKTKSAISTVALTSLGIMKKGYAHLSMPKYVMKQLTVTLILLLSNHSIVPFPPILLHMARTIKPQHL
jgi:hypothetical protein